MGTPLSTCFEITTVPRAVAAHPCALIFRQRFHATAVRARVHTLRATCFGPTKACRFAAIIEYSFYVKRPFNWGWRSFYWKLDYLRFLLVASMKRRLCKKAAG